MMNRWVVKRNSLGFVVDLCHSQTLNAIAFVKLPTFFPFAQDEPQAIIGMYMCVCVCVWRERERREGV